MKFFIKICGITSPEDAEMVAAAGADAVGINFWPRSKRFVTDDRAREIAAAVPNGVEKVGVFVNAHPLVVTEAIADFGLDRVQLHGDEKPGAWTEIESRRIIRAIRVADTGSLKDAQAWEAGLYIYDAFLETYGGGGVQAPWEIIAKGARRPFLLAGGLTPDNVVDAIRAVHPDGLDVASGVESEPGMKDPAKVKAFIAAARQAMMEITSPEL